MSDPQSRTRRSVVLSTSALALGGLTALAGCSGGSGGSGDGGSGGDGSGGDGGSDGTTTEGGDTATEGDGGGAGLDDWFSNVDNYESVVDETGSDRVTVAVGAQGNGGAFAFDPPAVRVSTGTTVVWEWTGQGQQHNVAADGGGFESDLSAEEGFTFEHTFSSAGTVRYVCTPHRALGMKGAVIVE
ncbi:halocyanin domain-containing protein [Haloplanus pelagicus]|jgi:halocyanin-like protein|uniref:halocyanin domain-containing protein n=1 Tax=Haloplanus pelagicus TaxID=2949995 RepID=UPI00203E589B|nr:halocyanin domain-containing protein [Haloplanus sp. HW8-1]